MIFHFEWYALWGVVDELFVILAQLDRIGGQRLETSNSETTVLISCCGLNLAVDRLTGWNGCNLDIFDAFSIQVQN